MLKRNYRMTAILFAIALMLACAPVAVATPPAPPTFDLLSLNTIIAETAGAAATQTFVLQPTLTPSPTITKTPTEIPTSTPTFVFVLSTPTVPSSTPTLDANGAKYACKIVSKTPADDTVFAKGIPFKTHWQVLNTGTFAWDENSSDYRYMNGDKLHQTAGFDFNESVPTGGIISIIVEMKAPNDPGTYKTTWRISVGKERFCPMSITIVVN
jgi:Ig-like domain from next to BRCA1 gene